MSYPAPPPPADWYPDPHGGSYLRWWNGIAWAEQTKPDEAQTAMPFAARDTLPLNPTLPTLPYPSYPGAAVTPAVPSYAAVVPYTSYGAVAPYGSWRSRADDRPYIRGMGDAVRVVFQKYATFEGRATRSEFWYWYLFLGLVIIGSVLVAWIPVVGGLLTVGLLLFSLAVIIPTYAVVVRRLRDAGLHWAFIFLALIPFGGIALFVMWCLPSKHT